MSDQVKHPWNPPETNKVCYHFGAAFDIIYDDDILQKSHIVTKDVKFQQLFHVLGHLNSDHNLRTRFLADTQACHLTKREKMAKKNSVCPPKKKCCLNEQL